jgi:hypothetical protein
VSEQPPYPPVNPSVPPQQHPQQPPQYASVYGAPPAQQPQPPQPTRRSPVFGFVVLGVAVLGLVVELVMQVVQRIALVQGHYSASSFGLISGVSLTLGILIDLVVIALALVALFSRRGVVPAAVALGAASFGLLSVLGTLLVNAMFSFGTFGA